MIKTALTAIALAAAVLAAPAQAADAPSSEVSALLQSWAVNNDHCRGGSGDNPETWKFCDARDQDDERLAKLGWCYGKPGQSGAEQKWHPCRARRR